MKIIKTIKCLREELTKKRRKGASIGFVPTMGALHQGHLSLVQQAKAVTDCVVVSIFVNPKQFACDEDFAAYPRDLEKDAALLENEKIDFIFAPDVEEMWPVGNKTRVEVTELSDILLGALRPGHFCGVTTVVAKLLNIVCPDKIFFGEKDFQQLTIIRQMVEDLAFPTTVVPVPTLRDADGVAASSRNAYLTPAQRAAAVVIPTALSEAAQAFKEGVMCSEELKVLIRNIIAREPLVRLESVEIRDSRSLHVVKKIHQNAIILLTAIVGKTRLLDEKELKS